MRRSQVRKSDLTRRLLSWGSCHWHSDQSEDDGSHDGEKSKDEPADRRSDYLSAGSGKCKSSR